MPGKQTDGPSRPEPVLVPITIEVFAEELAALKLWSRASGQSVEAIAVSQLRDYMQMVDDVLREEHDRRCSKMRSLGHR
jgi:hypothetical protein